MQIVIRFHFGEWANPIFKNLLVLHVRTISVNDASGYLGLFVDICQSTFR
jgi:hypothetical protein